MLHDLGLLVLRLGASGLMLFGHGLPKILEFRQMAQKFSRPF